MENFTEKEQELTLYMLSVAGDMNVVLKSGGYGFEKGLYVIVEDAERLDEFMSFIVYVTDAVPVKQLHKKDYGISNDTFGIHRLSKNDRLEYVAEFLEQEGFMPVIVSGGCMDDAVAEYAHVFLFGDYPFMEKREAIRSEIRELRNFLHDNTDIIGWELKDFHNKEDYNKRQEGNMLYYPLLFAARMCCQYYQALETGQDTGIRYGQYMQCIREIMVKSEYDLEISDTVWDTFVLYLEHHTEVSVCRKDGLEGSLCMQFENGKCILYDELFYYLPDELMRSICGTLTVYTGYASIKNALYRDGILLCNNSMHKNYTVKKVFHDASGQMYRKRVLILKKELFVPWGSPALEERRNRNDEISWRD